MMQLVATLTAVLGLVAPPPGLGFDASRGTPGFCPTDEGVTVVVDFQQLGGTTIVRCAPGPIGRGYTGHAALVDAGFAIDGTRRWGEAFVCRLEGRPSADEKLSVRGRPNYREPCIDTPPASAYWSYWHADNGGQWKYSQRGVKNREVIRGGFEGWSFSLNASTQSIPQPRIAPIRPRPDTTRPPATAPTTTQPDGQGNNQTDKGGTTTSPGQQPGTSTTTVPGTSRTGPVQNRQGNSTLPPGLPRSRSAPTPDPTDTPTWTGGENVAAGNSTGADRAEGIPVGTVLAGIAVLVLAVAAGLTARYRRRRPT